MRVDLPPSIGFTRGFTVSPLTSLRGGTISTKKFFAELFDNSTTTSENSCYGKQGNSILYLSEPIGHFTVFAMYGTLSSLTQILPVIILTKMKDSSNAWSYVGRYSTYRGYFSPGSMVPVPLSVATLISLGNRTKLNCWGKSEWFSMTKVHLDALLLNKLPKSSCGGMKVIALTVKTQSKLNFTGSTWLAPVTLTGIFIVNSSYSSTGGSSFYLTK